MSDNDNEYFEGILIVNGIRGILTVHDMRVF